MADAQIVSPDAAGPTKDYTLPNAQELLLKACFAHFDGSAAAGAFYPTLQIISDSGHVAASIPMDSTVNAGSSVEATWAPFLRTQQPGVIPGGTPQVPSVLYDFTVTTPVAAIDTATDGPYAGPITSAFFLLESWWYMRTDEATTQSPMQMQINGDAGANYDRDSAAFNITTAYNQNIGTTGLTVAGAEAANSTAGYFSVVRMTFPNYATSAGFKSAEVEHAHIETTTAPASNLFVAVLAIGWRSTAPVSRLRIFPTTAGVKIIAGSRVLIYGR